MNYKTETTDDFDSAAKRLLKKYPSFSDDLKRFKKELFFYIFCLLSKKLFASLRR